MTFPWGWGNKKSSDRIESVSDTNTSLSPSDIKISRDIGYRSRGTWESWPKPGSTHMLWGSAMSSRPRKPWVQHWATPVQSQAAASAEPLPRSPQKQRRGWKKPRAKSETVHHLHLASSHAKSCHVFRKIICIALYRYIRIKSYTWHCSLLIYFNIISHESCIICLAKMRQTPPRVLQVMLKDITMLALSPDNMPLPML